MKPLDEVIEDAERCLLPFPGDCGNCPHYDESVDTAVCMGKIIAEALEQLKMYQQEKGSLINARALTEEAYEKHSRWIENCRKAYEEMTERACKYREAEEELGAQKAQKMWVNKHFAFEEPNNPLTWDELKQMEGKPVWIEEYWAPLDGEVDSEKYWAIIAYENERRIGVLSAKIRQGLLFKTMGDVGNGTYRWQAFRKERA